MSCRKEVERLSALLEAERERSEKLLTALLAATQQPAAAVAVRPGSRLVRSPEPEEPRLMPEGM